MYIRPNVHVTFGHPAEPVQYIHFNTLKTDVIIIQIDYKLQIYQKMILKSIETQYSPKIRLCLAICLKIT